MALPPKKSRLAVISIYSVIFAAIILSVHPFWAIYLVIIKWDLPVDVLSSSLVKLQLILPIIGYIFGILFGCAARISIRKSGGLLGGKADARNGVKIGATLLVIHLIGLLWLVPALGRSRELARRMSCLDNLRSLVQMCQIYAIDNDNNFPSSFTDLEKAGYTIGNLTCCPTAGANAYGFNAAACARTSPADTPLIADFDSSNHNDEGGNIGYVDGSVRWYKRGFLRRTLHGSYSAGSGPLKDVSPEDWVRQ